MAYRQTLEIQTRARDTTEIIAEVANILRTWDERN